MWTKGLDPWRIAVLCRVPYRKVSTTISAPESLTTPNCSGSGSWSMISRPCRRAGLKKPKPTWEERAADLVDFRQVYGRFPRGYLEGESSLYSFLQSQRGRYRAGKLRESRKSHLDENLPGWLTLPKAEREHALWQQRLRELEKFLRQTERYPRYETAASSSEKVLAVWITHQRKQLRSGELSEPREKKLQKAIPGWSLSSGQSNEGR